MSLPGTLLHRTVINRLQSARPQRFFSAHRRVGRCAVIAALWASTALSGEAQIYSFTTFAGMPGIEGGTNGTGTAYNTPFFSSPAGIVVDGAGNSYVADTANHTIRKITPAGVVTTLAGIAGAAGSADGTGSAAKFAGPQGSAIDSSGNIYVADFGNHTIRKINSTTGVVTTLAGKAGLPGSVNGTGTAAQFNSPIGVAVDGSGNVYVADTQNHLIRKITSAGVVTTVAGTASIFGWNDGAVATATFRTPYGVAVNSSGDVYVADTGNNTIRKITLSSGLVTTIAGTANTFGSLDGLGTAARFDFPNSLAIDATGNIYVADAANHTIRKIDTSGVVTTYAGNAANSGVVDALGSAARFNHPTSISLDSTGTLYVADYSNQLIRKIAAGGNVTTLAGVAGTAGSADGTGFSYSAPAYFAGPSALAAGTGGDIFVADTKNQMIRKITSSGVTSTLAGAISAAGSSDGNGSAARFFNPTGLTVQGTNVYVTDNGNHTIRKITDTKDVTTFAGTVSAPGNVDGTGIAAKFNLPSSLVADSAGNLYVADYNNNLIRKITPAGVVTTFAGTGAAGSADGSALSATFNHPRSLAIDSTILYVADTGNHIIRTVSLSSPMVSRLAGAAGATGSADGIGTAARFNGPWGIAVNTTGTVFVSDSGNQTIRAISPAGVVTTIAGSPGLSGSADGIGSAVRFFQPTGLTISGSKLYVADYRNNTIRVGEATASGPGTGPGPISGPTPTGNGLLSLPEGIIEDLNGLLIIADTANNCIKKFDRRDNTLTLFAGSSGTAGAADGTGTAATFRSPTALAIDNSNNIYVADKGNATIRKITPAGVVTTIAGSSTSRGNLDGVGSAATFQTPAGLAMDVSGNLYVADSTTSTIRKINTFAIAATTTAPIQAAVPAFTVQTIAGSANATGESDGVGVAARFNGPTSIALGTGLYLFIADTGSSTIRKMNIAEITSPAAAAYTVSTIAGSPGISGSYDGVGNYALFAGPTGLTLAGDGRLYITDTENSLIRAIISDATNSISVFTVSGIPGIAAYRDGYSGTALFNRPKALTAASDNTVYVADTGNSAIRQISGNSVTGYDLKAAATPTTTTPTPTPTPVTSSGGGAMEAWFAGSFLLLLAAVFGHRRERA